MKISVSLCTHNPRMDYLNRVILALRNQTLPFSEWELLLIDNACTEPLAARFDIAGHPGGRIIREETLGVAFARLRAITESRGDMLVFVDDDNVLNFDYLAQSLRIAAEWPSLGAWGGSIAPEFEVPPPVHLRPYLKLLALREVTEPRWSNVWNCKEAEPWTAGLSIRKRAAMAYLGQFKDSQLRITGRTGSSLIGGEDTELAYVTCSLGFGMGIFPDLKLVHLIPKQRLDDSYIARIAQGTNTSSLLLFFKWGGVLPPSPYSAVVLARLLKHCLLKTGIERRLGLAGFRATIAATAIIRRIRKENPPGAFVTQ